MSIAKVDEVTLMILRLTIGGENGLFDCPDIVTEPVTDLGNDSLNSDWDETEFSSPHIDKMPKPILLLK